MTYRLTPPVACLLLACLLGVAACSEIEEIGPARDGAADAATLSAYLPTVELAIDADDFAEMTDRPKDDLEVDADVTLWREGRELLLARPAEVQVKGNYSTRFAAKSLGIKFDDALEAEECAAFRPPVVRDGHRLDRIKTLRLRNGGNEFEGTLIKDLAYARMLAASDLRPVCLYGEPAAAFVNGEFYSLLNLRTEHNRNGLSRLLDVDEERLAIAKVNYEHPLVVKDGREGFWEEFEATLATRDPEAVGAAIDEDDFIDFLVAGSIFGTWDWPWGNVRLYSVDEGPVRFVLFDFDPAAAMHTEYRVLELLRDGPDSPIRRAFEVCYAQPRWRARFEARYAEVMASGQLSPEALRRELQALAAVLDPVIHLQTARYGFPSSGPQWYADLERVVSDYALRYDQLTLTPRRG